MLLVRPARARAPPPSPSPCSTWRCTSSPSPCSCRPRRRASCARRSCPALVDDPEQLVAANSRLARLNVVAGAVGGAVGGGVLWLTSSPALTLALACVDVHRRRRVPRSRLPRRSPRRRCDAAQRGVRGAAHADDRRHGVGVHGRAWRRRVLRLRPRLRPAPGERAGVDVRRRRRRLRRRHVRRQRRRPAAAAALRRGPPDGRLARRPRRSSPPSAPSARPGRSCSLVVARPRRRRLGRPPGFRRAGPDAAPRSPRAAGPSPASRPASSSAGSPARSPPRRSPCPTRVSLAVAALGPDPGRRPLRPGPARGPRRPRRGSLRPPRRRPPTHRARHRVAPPTARTGSP